MGPHPQKILTFVLLISSIVSCSAAGDQEQFVGYKHEKAETRAEKGKVRRSKNQPCLLRNEIVSDWHTKYKEGGEEKKKMHSSVSEWINGFGNSKEAKGQSQRNEKQKEGNSQQSGNLYSLCTIGCFQSHFLLLNSTLLLLSIQLNSPGEEAMVSIGGKSVLFFEDCEIRYEDESKRSPIELHTGSASFVNISLIIEGQTPLFHSLAFSPNDISVGRTRAVSMIHSTFSSVLLSPTPFLCNGPLSSISLFKCTFSNITKATPAKSSRGSENDCFTKIDSCSFVSVEDAIYGGVVDSMYCPLSSLLSVNNSYIRCNRLRFTENEGRRQMGRQVLGNGTHTFESCEWSGCNATNGAAIYLYDQPQASLNISNCIFDKCTGNESFGGAISTCNILGLVIVKSNFTECKIEKEGGGAIYAVVVSTFSRLFSLHFLKCICEGHGAGFFFDKFNISRGNDTTSGAIVECTFDSNDAGRGWGGAFRIDYSPKGFSVRSCNYLRCVGGKAGGAITMEQLEFHDQNPSLIWFCMLHECFTRDAELDDYKGHDAYFFDPLSKRLFQTPFVESYTTNLKQYRVTYNNNSWNYPDEWIPIGIHINPCFIGVTGNDNEDLCGLEESLPCKTLFHSVEKSNRQCSYGIVLLEGNHISERESLNIREKEILLRGTSRNRTVLHSSGIASPDSLLFSVSTGSLLLESFTILHNHQSPSMRILVMISSEGECGLDDMCVYSPESQTQVEFECSMFEVDLGRFWVRNSRIERFKLSSVLIADTLRSASTMVLFGNVTFGWIERVSGGGSVVNMKIGDGEGVRVENVSVNNCSSVGGDGGGMRIEIGDGGWMRLGEERSGTEICGCLAEDGRGGGIAVVMENAFSSMVLENVVFRENRAVSGRNVFVISPDLGVSVSRESFKFFSGEAPFGAEDAAGVEVEAPLVVIPLVYYLMEREGNVSVGSGGVDVDVCGFGAYPCRTVGYGVRHRQQEGGVRQVVVLSPFKLEESIVMGEDAGCIVGGVEEKTVVEVVGDGRGRGGVIELRRIAIVKEMKFAVGGELQGNERCVVYVNSIGANVSVQDCMFVGKEVGNEIGYRIMCLENGECSITRVSVEDVRFSGVEIVECFGGQSVLSIVNMKTRNVGGAFGKGLISGERMLGVEMNSSDFVCGDECFGGMVSVVHVKRAEMKNCTGVGIGKGEGDGAVVRGVVSNGEVLMIEGGEMSGECGRGNGGGVGAVLEDGGRMELGMDWGVRMRNCKALGREEGKGFGGGVYIDVREGASWFVLKGIEFEGCVAEASGGEVFVKAMELKGVITRDSVGLAVEMIGETKWTGVEEADSMLFIPLCIYLLPTPEEIYVSNVEASNHSHCGIVEFPCLTMKHSLTRQTGEKKIVVNGMILMSDELAFAGQKHEIRGNDDQSGWTVSDTTTETNTAMVTVGVETVLSALIFSLPSSLPLHQTFVSSSSHLTLSHCSISLQDPSSELACLFLSVDSGSLVIDFFSASSITLSTTPLISLSGSGTNAELMITTWLNMTNCTFTEIERAAGSGGCVSIGNSHDDNANTQINIEECVFDGCSVLDDGSRGGAIDVQMKGNIQMNIISCTFTGCSAPAGEEGKSGFGGGMALKLIDGDSSFVISSPVFDTDKPNAARYGNNLFVESSNLTKSITNDSLPFVSEHLADISLDSLSGFDGSDKTNAIPLVYFWRRFGSEIVVGGDGKDVCICGLSDYPCLSIDHSFTRLPEGNERNIKINGKGILQKSVDISGVTIKSEDNDVCSLECLSSLEGSEGAAMKICGITNFELIKFVIPSSFMSGVNYLMHVESSEGLLTVKDCSFTKNEENDVEEIMNYGLIKADGGTVVLELVSIQSLGFSHDVVSVLSTTILNIYNLTMKSIELEGASGLKISKSSRREKNEEEQDVLIEWSSFEEVTQNTTDDIPIIRNDNDVEPLKIVMRNTTMKKCGGTRCGKGGGMFCMLNEGGSFVCSFCTISECFCSTTGRGGWLFLECSSVAEHPLSFVLSNLTFKDNTALRGRDVYVRCHSIETQIVDEQFLLDFRAPFVKELAMWGCSTDSFEGEEDLLLRVVKYQSETIFVSACAENHSDFNSCGELHGPCESLNVGVKHIIPSSYSQLLISKETAMRGKCSIHNVVVHPLESPPAALVHLSFAIVNDAGGVITTSGKVRVESVKFDFGQSFSFSGSSVVHETSGQLSLSFVDFSSVGGSNSIQPVVLNSSLLSIESGIVHVDNCSVSLLSFKKPSFLLSGDEISLTNVKLEEIESTADVFEIGSCGIMSINGVSADGVKLSDGCILAIGSSSSGTISVGSSSFDNCSRNSEGASVLSASSTSAHFEFSNCSCTKCYSLSDKGRVMEVINMKDAYLNMCEFEGLLTSKALLEHENDMKEICEWNGSVVHSTNSTMVMKYTTISNASSGGFSVSAGDVTIEKGEFLNNNPFIEKYPSLRRNIICSDSASLTISSLKGGDGLMPNSSFWILNDGCTLGGIAGERPSSFFIPRLEEVSVNESGSKIFIQFKGSLFVPCDLSFRLVYKTGDVELVETYRFEEDSFVSENEVIGRVPSENISLASDETEVSVTILFGKQSAETFPLILKNRSEPKGNGDERIVEGRKEGKSIWPIIVIILVVILLIVLIGFILFAIRWKKAKNENKDLREIVNETVKKDPKAFEMVTMEMSPEEQWRRAEREAEKKNEERMKKRVYEKSLGHSESSEHLLSESGSTEYILGRDSDKIPEWMLEKVEEEEIRKQAPSPSISSTSTTDTSDTDSTFVRGEDLCPTTSSMSNLVDAMACSSPHEKLIVDLRDSLFMLLHGKNKTKEMAIGTLQEREYTAVQILFWVANGALHSFDECEVPLQSLTNLSPHIVLFSEHMVICVAMHSDCSSSDSDSSSISSSTVVTSTSDDGDERDSLPSSAFEDEDAFRKECLRWKAPELLNGTKKRATKKTVVFSIGMMLWECLTLKVPFGEYEAEVAGQKIVNGERPCGGESEASGMHEMVKGCWRAERGERVTLMWVKRELFGHFPGEAAAMTMTDAILYEESKDNISSCESLVEYF
eukprot:MONOS_5693.1-p1 / transcript=MONOS_5693.1 / gene=MONOS_5693 / organism=Monocercomonoides_exilis_PA203 / gene_product=unspecified product / transcript_product=unspecified product / location=Mono_scaffold00169:18634-27765(-) / protein_length=3043 / sequence_SO=supercontig / SO=protein_coding / is_pseudo=false